MKNYIDKMATKFLSWPLPKSVCADLCATKHNYEGHRVGTNLLSHKEATEMCEYLFSEILDEHENLQKFTTDYQNKCAELTLTNRRLELKCNMLEEQRERNACEYVPSLDHLQILLQQQEEEIAAALEGIK